MRRENFVGTLDLRSSTGTSQQAEEETHLVESRKSQGYARSEAASRVCSHQPYHYWSKQRSHWALDVEFVGLESIPVPRRALGHLAVICFPLIITLRSLGMSFSGQQTEKTSVKKAQPEAMPISKHALEWVAWGEIPWQVGDIRVSMHGYALSWPGWHVACRHQVPPPRFIRTRSGGGTPAPV